MEKIDHKRREVNRREREGKGVAEGETHPGVIMRGER